MNEQGVASGHGGPYAPSSGGGSEKLRSVFGAPVDEGALAQIENVLRDDRAVTGALMADHHLGYSMPIGGVVAYKDAISPSGVGFDIACGNKCVRTNLMLDDVVGAGGALRVPAREPSPGHPPSEGALPLQDAVSGNEASVHAYPGSESIAGIMREIQRRVSFGVGRVNEEETVEHELFDSPVWDDLDPTGYLKARARLQLGTVGAGNHYVDLLYDDSGRLWVANHFGSRGFGHTVASGFLAIAQGKSFTDRVKESEEPAVLDIGSPSGDTYVEAMRLAGEYAYAGRDYVIDQVLRILGAQADFSVHNHHNYAWLEDGLWVVRKGATPLTDQPAYIGGSMGDVSVIVRGTGEDIGALGSAPHGAGRVMSRTKAAGKWKKVPVERTAPDGSTYTKKVRVRDKATAAIDFDEVKADLASRGIVVLGSGADEAPAVYKNLRDVLAHHANIEVLHVLHPIGVVMAGDDTYDPYKD